MQQEAEGGCCRRNSSLENDYGGWRDKTSRSFPPLFTNDSKSSSSYRNRVLICRGPLRVHGQIIIHALGFRYHPYLLIIYLTIRSVSMTSQAYPQGRETATRNSTTPDQSLEAKLSSFWKGSRVTSYTALLACSSSLNRLAR